MDTDTLRLWPWVLTALQVVGLWAAGRGLGVGWLLGGSVQIPWIVYALLTDQIGFLPGCLVSACVQLHSYASHARRRRAGAYLPIQKRLKMRSRMSSV